MQFNSLEEMIAYIEKQQAGVAKDMGDEMVQIMKEEVQKQVYASYKPKTYQRTRDMMNSPQIKYFDKNQVVTEFMMMGSWTSYSGSPFFPMYALEGNTVYGRSGTNIMDVSCNRIESKIPNVFVQEMRSRGIPIR